MTPPQIVFGPPPRQLSASVQGWAAWALALEQKGFVALIGRAYTYERKLGDGVVMQAVLVPTAPPAPEGFEHCRLAVISRYADGEDDRELAAFLVMTAEGLNGVLELPARKGKRK